MWAVVQDKNNRLRHCPGFFLGCPGAGTNRSAPHAAHTREIVMCQRFALAVVAIKEEDDVADLSLRLVQLEPKAYTLDLTCNPDGLPRVPEPPPAGPFLQQLGQLRPADLNSSRVSSGTRPGSIEAHHNGSLRCGSS